MTQGSDTFAGAPLISEGVTTAATPTSGLSLTLEPGEKGWHNASFNMSRTAWWKFVASSTGDISINLLRSENVGDWNTLQFAMVAIYTGDTLTTLDKEAYAFSSDAYHATGLSNAPELLFWVEEGGTYHVQALLRDTARDIDYRLQVARYADTETGWIQDPDYIYDVPRYVDPQGDLVATVGGDSKMFDALNPRLVSEYVTRPNNGVLNDTMRTAIANAIANPVNNTWSSESATLFGEVGTFRPVPGGGPFGADGEDITMRNYAGAYREFTYAVRDYDALISHRFVYEFPADFPEGALGYDWEGIERSQVLEADAEILIKTHSAEGTALMEDISPADLTYMFKVKTGSTKILPPMPTTSNDNAASDIDSWVPGDADTLLATAALSANATTFHQLDMTPYINTDGTFVLSCGVDPGGFWDPPDETGWALNTAKATMKVSEVVYLVRPPRRRWSVRTYVEAVFSTPYRRNFPRDDGLAGGARRNYPPSKSVQSGNRNVGGYL